MAQQGNIWGPARSGIPIAPTKGVGQPGITPHAADKSLALATLVGKGVGALMDSGTFDTEADTTFMWGKREQAAIDKRKAELLADTSLDPTGKELADLNTQETYLKGYKDKDGNVLYGTQRVSQRGRNFWDRIRGKDAVKPGRLTSDEIYKGWSSTFDTPLPDEDKGDAGDTKPVVADVNTDKPATPDSFVVVPDNATPNQTTEVHNQNARYVNDGVNTVKAKLKDAKFHVDSFFGGDLTPKQTQENNNLKGLKKWITSPTVTQFFLANPNEYAAFVADPMVWYTTKGPGKDSQLIT